MAGPTTPPSSGDQTPGNQGSSHVDFSSRNFGNPTLGTQNLGNRRGRIVPTRPVTPHHKETTMRRPTLMISTAAAVALLLGACSSGSDGSTADSTAADSTAQAQAPTTADGAGQQEASGVSGEIAAISDTLLQVQGDDGQTAVSWSDTTTFTTTVTGSVSDITVGVCLTAFGDSIITVSQPTDGECAAFGGMAGAMPGGMPGGDGAPAGDGASGTAPSGMPDGMPTDLPSGAAGGRPDGMPTDLPSGAAGMGGAGGGTLVTGLVTAVDGSTITVAAADDASEPSTVTVADDAVVQVRQAADVSALAVGLCATVRGEADTRGQVAATSISLSTAGDSGCSTGMGGGPMGGQRPGAGDGSGASDGATDA